MDSNRIMRRGLFVAFTTSSIWCCGYLLYYWFVRAGQSSGAKFPLGMTWLFAAQLQLVAMLLAALNRKWKFTLWLGGTSFAVFVLTTAYFILFI